MKVYFAGEIPENRNKVGLFLGGITNLGNSWRYYLLKKLNEVFEFTDIDVFVPEPKDTNIKTWRDFMNTMPKGFNQIEWERQQSEYCQIWTMFLPTYANKYDSGEMFSTPSSDPKFMYPVAFKCLEYAYQNNIINEKEYNDELLKLTISNIGCQVRFEAGYLVGLNRNLPYGKKINIIWGKVYNSLQISFEPYLRSDETMHVLLLDDIVNNKYLPDSFVEEVIEYVKIHINNIS